MRTSALAAPLFALALFAGACGNDESTTTIGDDRPTNDEPPVAEPGSTDPGDTSRPLDGGPYPVADLTLTVDQGDGTAVITYRLTCLGDTATFTGDTSLAAHDGCITLTEPDVRTRLLTDDHLDRVCTEQYGGPQTATISGTLDEQTVDASIDRANGCGINDWDALLLPLLPEVG